MPERFDLDLERLVEEIERLGVLEGIHSVPLPEGPRGIRLQGTRTVRGRVVSLQLLLDASFPWTPPRVFLCPWDAVGIIPHVVPGDYCGLVCYADGEGLLLDSARPADIVVEALTRAVAAIEAGIDGVNAEDFADEYENYWARLGNRIEARSVVEPVRGACWGIVATRADEPPWLALQHSDLQRFYNGKDLGGLLTVQRAFILPLAPEHPLMPPRPDRPFWTAGGVRTALLPSLSEGEARRLKRLLAGRTRQREWVVVQVRRPSGGSSLVGLRFDGVGRTHPLLEGGTAERVQPVSIARRDASFLVRRGGGEADLSEKRVLVLGAGAVGGHVALGLAHAGVLDLTLVDDDLLLPENSFRHILGRRHWGTPKVEALKEEIEANLPFVHVTAVRKSLEAALDDRDVDLAAFGLVVSAMGNPTAELALNRLLRKDGGATPAVFAWLEPLGIGGHALLTGVGEPAGQGCFACLIDEDEDDGLYNRAAFAARKQSFGVALSGCGSLHTPYGAADAVETANRAVRLSLDALLNRAQGSTLVSWKGDPAAFTSAGFRLTRRFQQSDDELRRAQHAFRNPECPVCGGGEGLKATDRDAA